ARSRASTPALSSPEVRLSYDLRTVFFFQAEDGIRYRNVTGVQTCALPILRRRRFRPRLPRRRGILRMRLIKTKAELIDALSSVRSEERRVGKECRWRRWRCQNKKKEMKDEGNAQETEEEGKGQEVRRKRRT